MKSIEDHIEYDRENWLTTHRQIQQQEDMQKRSCMSWRSMQNIIRREIEVFGDHHDPNGSRIVL